MAIPFRCPDDKDYLRMHMSVNWHLYQCEDKTHLAVFRTGQIAISVYKHMWVEYPSGEKVKLDQLT